MRRDIALAHTRPSLRPPASLARFWSLAELPSGARIGRLAFFGALLVTLTIGVFATVNAARWLDRPFAGFLVNQRLIVQDSGLYHWTGLQAGLKFPARILEVDGVPIASIRELREVVGRRPVGAPVSYTVQLGTEQLRVTVPTMRFTVGDLLVMFGVPSLSGLVYFALGALVFVLKPDTRASWAFLTACFFLSLNILTSFGIVSAGPAFVRLFLFVTPFVPAAFVHLGLVFPERSPLLDRRPALAYAPYLVAALLALPLELLYPHPVVSDLNRAVRVYWILGAIALIFSTVHAYARGHSTVAIQRAKVVLFGAALAFPIPAVVMALPHVGLGAGVRIPDNFLAIPILVFPASIAYAIARHNLFDVDVYIKRAVGYGIMTAIVATGYVSLHGLLNALVLGPVFGEYRETVYPLAIALVVVFLFNPLNRRVQEAVDRVFFRKQFDYKKTVSAVSSVLTSMLNLDQIIHQVIHTIRREMFVDTVGVVVLEPKEKACRTFVLGEDPELGVESWRPVVLGYDDPLLALVREQRALLTRYDIEEDPRYAGLREPFLARFADMGATMAIPLLYQGEVTGLLALGLKKSGHFYSRDDIDLLSTMADQAAVAIENATTHEEVVRYAEELAASLRRIQILESIKTNLSKFVPKTVQELIEESPEAPSLEKREIDVSVLFADITGYTRLSAQMDLGTVNRLVERYFGAFLDEILSRGGDVNETAGDGLMVIFRKKDPRRHARAAVLAALGIQRRAREINVELAGQSEPITMKVGVNSGIAAVGATRIEGAAGTRWTYTASGPTTNVAARLAALSEGDGAIVISEATRMRLGDEFEVDDLGPQPLKNVPEPVRAFRVRRHLRAQAARAEPPLEGPRASHLYIVSRDHPEVYEELTRRFQNAPDVHVVLDRRFGERQLSAASHVVVNSTPPSKGEPPGEPGGATRPPDTRDLPSDGP